MGKCILSEKEEKERAEFLQSISTPISEIRSVGERRELLEAFNRFQMSEYGLPDLKHQINAFLESSNSG